MGDPGRVALVASHFQHKECEVESREFKTVTGVYNGKRITVVSTGIGCDNIDIVMNELDALANIDFSTREVKRLSPRPIYGAYRHFRRPPARTARWHTRNRRKAIGFDGVLNYYAGRNAVADLEFEHALCRHTGWNPLWAKPYVVDADKELVEQIGGSDMVRGNTISAVGFYGPQGRELRLPLANPDLNRRIEEFRFNGRKITNYEMESAPLQGLGRLMGHRAMTVCSIIANRMSHNATPNYKTAIRDLIATVLDRI